VDNFYVILLNRTNMSKGTYAAVKYSTKTQDKIAKFVKDLGIPNPLPASKLHTTVLYSRKYLEDLPHKTVKFDHPLSATMKGFDVWKTRPDDGSKPTDCLVIKLDSPQLTMLHEVLMDLHKATYDFEKYTPHISLSYDIADFQTSKISSHLKDFGNLEIVEFYVEDLDLNWAKNST
jgi:hypothetical protein